MIMVKMFLKILINELLCDNIMEECVSISFLDDGIFEAITLDGDISGTWSSGCLVGDSIFLESFELDTYGFFIISISSLEKSF